MPIKAHGSVAALQYNSLPDMEFADFVEEFDISFQMIENQKRSLSWDCDDVAIVERDTIRVALGWLAPDKDGAPYYIIIAVGPNPKVKHNPPDPAYYAALAKYITERTNRFLPHDAVMLGTASRPVGIELIDVVADLLKLSADAAPDDMAPGQPNRARGWRGRKAASDHLHHTTKPKHHSGRGDIIALPASSPPKRLTIYALSCTLMLQVPAIGAFMFVYAILRDTVPVT